MMLFDKMLRSGVWLRRRKKWLPIAFILSVVFAMMVTPPFTIIRNTVALTIVSMLLAACGIAVRCQAMRVRSKAIEDIIAAKGIYSVIRFPHYLANMLIILALTIYVGITWYLFFVILVGWIIVEKIILHEESMQLNKYGDTFVQWAKNTSCLLPNIINWSAATNRTQTLKIILSQAQYMFFVVAGFTAINLLKNIMIDFSFTVDLLWIGLLTPFGVLYLLSILGKK